MCLQFLFFQHTLCLFEPEKKPHLIKATMNILFLCSQEKHSTAVVLIKVILANKRINSKTNILKVSSDMNKFNRSTPKCNWII